MFIEIQHEMQTFLYECGVIIREKVCWTLQLLLLDAFLSIFAGVILKGTTTRLIGYDGSRCTKGSRNFVLSELQIKIDWLASSSRDFGFEKLMFNDGKATPDSQGEYEGGKASPLYEIPSLISDAV